MDIEKRKRFIVNFAYFAIILAIVIFICRYAMGTILPFVLAFLVSLLLRPVIVFLHEKCRIHKNAAAVVIVLLFYALIGFLLTILGIRLFATCKAFFLRLPGLYAGNVQPVIDSALDWAESFAKKLNPESAATFNMISANITTTLGNAVRSLSSKVLSSVTSVTFAAPRFLLNTLITVIATLFASVDLPLIKNFLMAQLSEKSASMVVSVRTHLGRTLWRYIKSYALILSITFVELSVGLLIIGIPGAVGIASVIALFDILPVVGSGTVLIPWAIICLVQQNYIRALGLGILYIVVLVVRNIIEPKIIGQHVGIHPLLTLSAMVVGTYVFGPIGLLGLPITLALIKSLNDAGVVHLINDVPDEPADPPAGPAEPPESAPPPSPEKKEGGKGAEPL